MNKKGNVGLYFGLGAATSIVLVFVAVFNNWSQTIVGIFGLCALICGLFWKFTK